MEDPNNFRLQKISMIAADVLLVVLGVIYAFSGEGPMAPMQFFWVVVSVSLGGVLAFIPFFLEFKIRANLAEYDRSQANLENAERIERVLAEIHEIAAVVARQADRSEEAMTKTAETVERLEKHQPGPGGEETKALTESVESLRKDVAQALESVASAEDTAALIGGVEVTLVSLSGQLEQVQYQLTKDAASRTGGTPTADQPPAPETEGDEAVEPSTLEEGADAADAMLKPGDTLPANIADDESVTPDADAVPAEDGSHGEPETAEEELEGAEDVPEDLEVKDEAYEAEISQFNAGLEAAADELAAEEGTVFTDARPASASAGVSPASTDEVEASLELRKDSEAPAEEGEPEEEAPLQPNLMDDLPPPRQKPRKSPKGATVLVAQVLIGIGNKPYVRGTGPGLSSTKGVPMEFLEIGKWQWTAPESDEPISCQIYKNDEVPASGDMIELEPGQRRTVSPSF